MRTAGYTNFKAAGTVLKKGTGRMDKGWRERDLTTLSDIFGHSATKYSIF